ncbi:MAG: hypothetical protein ACYDA2_00375 [Acidimicrobiales bacterium]
MRRVGLFAAPAVVALVALGGTAVTAVPSAGVLSGATATFGAPGGWTLEVRVVPDFVGVGPATLPTTLSPVVGYRAYLDYKEWNGSNVSYECTGSHYANFSDDAAMTTATLDSVTMTCNDVADPTRALGPWSVSVVWTEEDTYTSSSSGPVGIARPAHATATSNVATFNGAYTSDATIGLGVFS